MQINRYKMRLIKEDFIHHEDAEYDVYNRFPENDLSETDINKYDEKGRLLTEYIIEYIGGHFISNIDGGQFIWKIYSKKEYQYDNFTTRILKYNTGYTNESDSMPKWDTYGNEVENVCEVFPLNQLIEIQEIITDKKGNLLLNKLTDLKNNLISEKKYSYNEKDNLIEEVEIINNQIITTTNTSYTDNVINFISNGVYKTYYKFNENEKLIQITVYELKSNDEVLYGKISIGFEKEQCKKISFEIFANTITPNDNLDLYEHLFELFKHYLNEHIKLPYNGYYINSNTYYSLKKFEIKFDYNNNVLKQMTLYSDNVDEFIERRFYIYEYEDSILEYVAGFRIEKNEVIQLFSHKYKYL